MLATVERGGHDTFLSLFCSKYFLQWSRSPLKRNFSHDDEMPILSDWIKIPSRRVTCSTVTLIFVLQSPRSLFSSRAHPSQAFLFATLPQTLRFPTIVRFLCCVSLVCGSYGLAVAFSATPRYSVCSTATGSNLTMQTTGHYRWASTRLGTAI